MDFPTSPAEFLKKWRESPARKVWPWFSAVNLAILGVLAGLYFFGNPEPPAWCGENAIAVVKSSPADREGITIHQAAWRIYDLLKQHYHSMRIGRYRTAPVPDDSGLCDVELRYTIDDQPFTASWRLDRNLRIVSKNREARKIAELETRH